MYSAADCVAFQVRIVQGLGKDTLACKSAVTMDEEGKIFFSAAGAGAILLGPSTAHGHRIHSF